MKINLSPGVEVALSAIAEGFYSGDVDRATECAIKNFFLILALPEADQQLIARLLDNSEAGKELRK